MARSEEEDVPLADLELLVTYTVVEAPLERLEGHGRGGVMGAHLDALGDQREGEPERPRFDEGPADPAAPDVSLVRRSSAICSSRSKVRFSPVRARVMDDMETSGPEKRRGGDVKDSRAEDRARAGVEDVPRRAGASQTCQQVSFGPYQMRRAKYPLPFGRLPALPCPCAQAMGDAEVGRWLDGLVRDGPALHRFSDVLELVLSQWLQDARFA